ncbi:sugar kinase [Rubellimicrobium sp. CFH 75288]|uniref:sugar kinase n=1 Tax=Rubellimicrobium sp. CFH 75288 TaxID=2697034 RepID=UPI0014132DA4|nr:sugar kinase [Rubellimicrobium sp. CFH 75288]NAZ37023.1 sugar kinase [Rubellimicrobium sp. CFH 75288]
MTPTALRVACIGEAMIELSGHDPLAGTIRLGVAGDVFNTAVYLKRLLGDRAEVAFLSAVGRDPFSRHMEHVMEEEGLDASLLARLDRRLPGIYAISLDERGERSFHYWRSESAARAMLEPGGLDLDRAGRFDLVYFSGITLAILPAPARTRLLRWCAEIRAAGGRVAFDSNYRPHLWDSREAARAAFAAAWAVAGIALPSRDDEARLHPGEEPPDLFARLSRCGVSEVALKDGGRGPILWDGCALPPGEWPAAERVVDTTAAGDGFNAGYLAARLLGRTVPEAATAGHDLARRIVMHPGAIIPRQDGR